MHSLHPRPIHVYRRSRLLQRRKYISLFRLACDPFQHFASFLDGSFSNLPHSVTLWLVPSLASRRRHLVLPPNGRLCFIANMSSET